MSNNHLIQRFIAALVIAGGAMITWTCGSCTWSMVDPSMTPNNVGVGTDGIIMAMIFGGVPTLFGLAVIGGGVMLWRLKGKSDK